MAESDNNCESDNDSLCSNSIVVENNSSEPPSTSSDEDMLNWSQSITSGGSMRSSPVGPALFFSNDDDFEVTDIQKDDDDDTSNPLGETKYKIDDEVIVLSDDDDDVIVLSDGDDVTDPNINTATHSQPPPTLDELTSMVFEPSSKASVPAEEETAARSQPSPTFNRPMSMLSTFSSTSSTCMDGEHGTARNCNETVNAPSTSRVHSSIAVQLTTSVDKSPDTMVFCFYCDKKLYSEDTRGFSSTTPHSNVPYPKVIDELVGDICPIIVKPTDQLCMSCTSLLIRIDKIRNSIELIKNKFLSYSLNKYGTLPPVQTVNSVKKRQIYICELCSKKFDSPINCLDHVVEDHNLPTQSTSKGEIKTEDSHEVITRVIEPEPIADEDILSVECIVVEGKKDQDYGKVSFDKYMTLTDYGFLRESVDDKKRRKTVQESPDSVKE